MSDPCAAFAWTRAEWEAKALALSEPAFRGRQIFDAIHVRGILAYEAMSELSRAARGSFREAVPLRPPEVAAREVASDGSVKFALKFEDGTLVEAVSMPHGDEEAGSDAELADARAASPGGDPAKKSAVPDRATICLSSQAGCAVDCRFCVTGRLGAGRNLTAGEIVAQFLVVRRERPAGSFSIVFMGMGEPLANLDNVERALDVFFETMSPRRVTVSTSGFPDGIRRLGRRPRSPNLAVSINAADEETRTRIMPITRAYPLAEVLSAMRDFPLSPRRRITAEYVLLAGVNDSVEDARKLARLLRGLPVKINLIPFNPDPRFVPEFSRPGEAAIEAFVETLARERYTVTVRRSKGPDAAAACGQLKGRDRDPRQSPGSPSR